MKNVKKNPSFFKILWVGFLGSCLDSRLLDVWVVLVLKGVALSINAVGVGGGGKKGSKIAVIV